MQEGETKMKIGLCTPTKNIEKVKEIGYDYIEVAGNEIAAMTDEVFNAFVSQKEYTLSLHDALPEIGRASCRERVYFRQMDEQSPHVAKA